MPGGHPIVLIADPVAHTRALLQEVFESEFGAYVVAAEGSGTIELMAREVRPSLIVVQLDARRDVDFDVVRRIKAGPTPVPVLATVAWGQLITCQEALAAGCDLCLEKPFELVDLIEGAASLLEQPGTPASVH